MTTVAALFSDFDEALRVARELENEGFPRGDIGILANDATREFAPAIENEPESAALSVPGIGPVVAAGPLVPALAGAGIIGGLTEMGLSKEDAHFYTDRVTHGEAVVLVRAPEDRAIVAEAILEGADPEEFDV